MNCGVKKQKCSCALCHALKCRAGSAAVDAALKMTSGKDLSDSESRFIVGPRMIRASVTKAAHLIGVSTVIQLTPE